MKTTIIQGNKEFVVDFIEGALIFIVDGEEVRRLTERDPMKLNELRWQEQAKFIIPNEAKP